ncbi:MAG: transcriptional regulator [Chloroflexota bacterium]|nr:MAG: transcriptional regulator [Chloroflexota bacterium]
MGILITANPTEAVESALQVISGKWKVLIVWHLREGVRRYGELRRLIPGITEKMLIRQLRELEADEIITRTDYQTVPPHVEYSLSEYGQGLLPVLGALCQWGRMHLQHEALRHHQPDDSPR